jgi:pyruvate decarboxylase
MQYGSIGWSVGALLGYAQALKGIKRVIACIGDGSFQVCDDVTTFIFQASNDSLYICRILIAVGTCLRPEAQCTN